LVLHRIAARVDIPHVTQDVLHPGQVGGSVPGRVASMTDPNTIIPVIDEREDARTDGPMTGDERALLDHWLNLYRDTVLLEIAGLDAEALARRAVPPSSISLLGVVRHLTEVEAYWLRVVLLDEQDVPDYYCTPTSRDGDFDDVDPATAAADVAAYQAELSITRANAAAWTDLAVPVRGLRKGKQVNLRWVLTHLVEEYARHLGPMDLLRERVDGRTSY
jgi:uncharacterized damage-inducible protein DinB